MADNNVIGKNGELPWHLPNDMAYFRLITTGHTVLMGRKTYESIPEKFRPLPNRTNIILTRQDDLPEWGLFNDGSYTCSSIENAIQWAKSRGETKLFIAGGGEIYKESIGIADQLYITRVDASIEGDTYFPEVDLDNLFKWSFGAVRHTDEKNKHNHNFLVYEKKKL